MSTKRTNGLTPREYARRKKLGLQYVYVKIWSGRLQAEKRDGKWVILEEGKRAAAEEAVRKPRYERGHRGIRRLLWTLNVMLARLRRMPGHGPAHFAVASSM